MHNASAVWNPKLIHHLGCYQCSRRRIDCDRQQPTCQKCAKKGLACSGLGIRYRFNGSIASRGKLVGKTVPTTLSYGGDGSASPTDVKSNLSSVSYDKVPSHRPEQSCTARHENGLESQSGFLRMTPQWLLGCTKDGDRVIAKDEDATVTIRECLTQVDRRTQYLMRYCIMNPNESNHQTKLTVS